MFTFWQPTPGHRPALGEVFAWAEHEYRVVDVVRDDVLLWEARCELVGVRG